MEVFSIRDLRERVGELTREAEAGRLSLICRHGRPLAVTLPMEDLLFRTGVMFALAVRLYRDNVVNAAQAAKLCELEQRDFFEKLARYAPPGGGTPTIDPDTFSHPAEAGSE